MTDKELLEQLRTEVVAETPDCWSAILARVQAPAQQPEEEKIVPMPERGRRRGAWKRWVAAAAVFFLAVLGGGLYATQAPGGVATLDANPSIELTVNKLGRVLSARACNPDAQFVLDDLELRNQSLQTAADEIVAAMQTDGYLSADTNSVLVTVEAGKGDARLRDRLAAAVESAQTDCGMDPAVLAQVLEVDPELEAYASAAGVSAGKAMLIRQISDQVQDLSGEELVSLPINDLNILAASNDVAFSGMESIGAASTGAYIPYDEALQVALECCGLTADDVTQASMRFTLIDGEMVMEFALSDGERNYVCSVDAETAEVCRLTGDEPKQPEETEIILVPPTVQPNPNLPVTPMPTPTPTPTLVQLGEGELDRRIHRIGIHRRQLAARNAPCHTELTAEHRLGQVQQNFILGGKQIQIASSCNARFVNNLADRGVFIPLLQKKTNACSQDFLPCIAAVSSQINHLSTKVLVFILIISSRE